MARLGLDLKGFQTGMLQANQDAIRHAGNVGRAAGAHDRLLTSSHRAARQIGNIAQQLASGAGAADVFSSALTGAERVLRLPLGSLAGLAVFGVLVEQIYKATARAKELREEIDAITRAGTQNPRYESLEVLTARLTDANAKIKELQKNLNNVAMPALVGAGKGLVNPKGGLLGFLKDTLLGGPANVIAQNIKAEAKGQGDQAEQARKDAEKAKSDIASKAAESNIVKGLEALTGPHAAALEKIRQTEQEKVGAHIDAQGNATNPEAIAQAHIEAQLARDEENKKHEAQKREIALEENLTAIKRSGYDVDVRSAAAKLEYAKAALAAANAEETRAKAAKVAEAAAELESAARKKSDSETGALHKTLGQRAQEDKDAHDRQAVARAEADAARNTRKLKRDQQIEAELAKPGLSPDRKFQLEQEKFARQHGASTPEEDAAGSEEADLRFKQSHGGLTKEEQDRLEQVGRTLYGNEQIDKEKALGEAANPNIENREALQRERERLIADQAVSMYGATPPPVEPGQDRGRGVDVMPEANAARAARIAQIDRMLADQAADGIDNSPLNRSADKFDAVVMKFDKAIDELGHLLVNQ